MAKRSYKGRTEAYDQAALPAGAGMEFDAQEQTIAGAGSPKAWTAVGGEAGEHHQADYSNAENATVGQNTTSERHIAGNAMGAGEQMAI